MDGLIKCICYLAIIGIAAFLLGRILPQKWFHYDRFPWRMWKLEQGEAVYRKIRIHKWKEKFPDMSRIFPGIMPSKKVPRKFDPAQIREMIVETCIAEGVHGFLCLAGLGCLFFWKGPGGICAAVLYALGNIPYCLIQRYNRPKLVKILESLKIRKIEIKSGRKAMKKALILSCSTGQGHNSCARAVKEYFDRQQVDCTVADAFRFVSEKFARLMGKGYSFMYRHIPGLFRWGYGYSKKHPALFQEETVVYKILTAGTLRMYQYIAKEKFDTVICTHVLSAIMLTHMQKTLPLALKTAMVMTDYTCYPGMKATDLQRYFIPDGSLTEEFVKCGIPREKISVAGIPVCREFYKKIEKADAKRLLNVRADHRHLLVMCGSMGCGPIERMVDRLYENLPEDTEISVICGTNERLQKKLDRKYQGADQIHIAGYTKQMSLYMDSADLCLMKPGGLSVTEAAVKKLPMAFINAVAGCEQYNIEYFVKKGGAVSSVSPEELIDQCIRILQSERKLKEMEKALREYRRAEGAKQIFETMELLNTEKIYWKDTAYVERESDGLPQVPAGQVKYTRV